MAARQNVELRHAQQALDGDFDIIINATASSLAGAGVPVPASVLRPQPGLRHDVRPRRRIF
jgi:shikimate dehydrogenase